MNIKGIVLAFLLGATSSLLASDFVNYNDLSKKLKAEEKKAGNYATTDEVKKALTAKDWDTLFLEQQILLNLRNYF